MFIDKVKVLWFSNCVLSQDVSRGSGSWLFAMRDLIKEDVEMVNVTEGNVDQIQHYCANGICEYIVPQWAVKGGVPSMDNINKIKVILKEESPDLIHIWGTEKYWALLFCRNFISADNVLLEIQGVLTACCDVFYGGLTPLEFHRLISIKSLLFPCYSQKYALNDYRKRSQLEGEIVSHFKYVATQSQWTREQLLLMCPPETKYFQSLRPVRQDFVNADKWTPTNNKTPIVFCSYSYSTPFKGIHFLLKAIHLLVRRYPTIQLRIAGPMFMQKAFYRIGDYEHFLKSVIIRLKIENNVHFCGPLDAKQMINEIHKADVVVNPSLVESYSAAAAEALSLGAPTVLAYAGAMPGFSQVKQIALYYNPIDYRSLAAKIITLFVDNEIRDSLRHNAIEVMNRILNPDQVKKRQLEIYHEVIGK